MIKVYDFRCSNGHHFEQFVDERTETSRCGCGANGKRIQSATKCILNGADAGFPGAAMKWAKDHEKAARKSASEG